MAGIFISYRRQDSQSAAGRLADHLKEHIRGVPIFRDVETIEPGVDFIEAIGRALQSCAVLLAVIGPRWVSVQDDAGRRRLDDPSDYTRLEVATALQRPNVRVVPVLVEGAQMPAAGDLPEDLRALCRRNAIELSDKRWDYDVSQLVETLKKHLGLPTQPESSGPAPAKPQAAQVPWYRRLSLRQWGYVAGGLLVLGILAELGEEDASYPQPTLPMVGNMPPDNAPTGDGDLPGTADFQRAPAVPEERAPLPRSRGVRQPGAIPDLTGDWKDAEGGRYRIFQQGLTVGIEGISPRGPVYGSGGIANNVLTLNYTLNDTVYVAELEITPDRRGLRGHYASPITGETGMVELRHE
jgi:hypothetical protein